jgi:hypothetical protein
MTNIWEIIAAISAAIQTLAIIAALIYTAIQVRSATSDRHLSFFFEIHRLISDRKAILSRFIIFNELPSEPGKLTKEQFLTARETWELMDYIGTVAHYNLASKKMIVEQYSLLIARLWVKLEPHILHYRKDRDELAVYFEKLAKICLDYRRKKFREMTPPFYPKTEFVEPTPSEGSFE